MPAPETLHRFFVEAAERWPDRTAVVDPASGEVLYRELAELSDRLRDRLRAIGVRPGDRVGIYARKSIDAVAAIFEPACGDGLFVGTARRPRLFDLFAVQREVVWQRRCRDLVAVADVGDLCALDDRG